MTYSINYRNIQGTFNLVLEIDNQPEILIPTPLDKQGIELLLEDIVDFLEDVMWDVTDMSIQLSDEIPVLGVIVDLYRGEDDSDPISVTYWFEDYTDEEDEDDDVVITKFKKND